MIFASILLITALTLSAVAAFYSIAGLIAIFSAAPIPIMVMGGALEVGKIVSTVFLHNNWGRLNWKFKTYLVPAVMVLMFLTSIGVFGLLSKAHSDQNLVTGDAQSKVAIYDEKIATERDNIEQAKRALAQMNAQVDQMLGRSDTERGAERAVQIRKNQAKERAALQAEITKSQKAIAQLQEERAPFAAETRKIEAEVGPIKYIAALIYGDNPDQNILERAVRWVIILIVIVFDPLALTLILAANKQFEWAREGTGGWVHTKDENDTSRGEQIYDEPLVTQTDPLLDDTAAMSIAAEPEGLTIRPFTENEIAALSKQPEEVDSTIAELYVPKDEDIAAYNNERLVSKFDKESLAEEENPNVAATVDVDTTAENEVPQQPPLIENIDVLNTDYDVPSTKEGITQEDEWPDEEANITDAEPPLPKSVSDYDIPIRRGNDYAVRYQGKVYNLDAFKSLHPELSIQEDNKPDRIEETQCGFGDSFPVNPVKGDMFIRTDYLPDRLFKWNGAKWLEVDKNTTDSYTYNEAYIRHLIEKLEAGEYELEDLNEAEQAQVEEQIKQILNSKNV